MREEQIVQIQARLLPVPREVTRDVSALDLRPLACSAGGARRRAQHDEKHLRVELGLSPGSGDRPLHLCEPEFPHLWSDSSHGPPP